MTEQRRERVKVLTIKHTQLAEYVIFELERRGIAACIKGTSVHGSVYVKIRKKSDLRISDHGNTSVYYKFNLLSSVHQFRWRKKDDFWRLECPINDADKMISAIVDYLAKRKSRCTTAPSTTIQNS